MVPFFAWASLNRGSGSGRISKKDFWMMIAFIVLVSFLPVLFIGLVWIGMHFVK